MRRGHRGTGSQWRRSRIIRRIRSNFPTVNRRRAAAFSTACSLSSWYCDAPISKQTCFDSSQEFTFQHQQCLLWTVMLSFWSVIMSHVCICRTPSYRIDWRQPRLRQQNWRTKLTILSTSFLMPSTESTNSTDILPMQLQEWSRTRQM